ncbi:MAG: GAF domain-containing protein, partial [Nitrospirae bacterium]
GELARRLNERISDRAYHVTAEFMKNPWNSYSYEFSAFFAQFCVDISGDPQFHFTMGRRHAISPIIQALGRPFSIAQIYKLSPYFARVYHAKEVFYVDAVKVSNRSAILRMGFGDSAYPQFGPYLRGCAKHWCAATKGYFVGVPEIYRHLQPATALDRRCMVEGDDCCEWEVTWSVEESRSWPVVGWLARRALQPEIEQREKVIDEQLQSLDSWQEELKEAYVQQQQLTADLQRKVDQLTTLHEASAAFTSTLARETLIERVLDTIVRQLHYDRAMLTFFDPVRQVASDARILGVSADITEFARSLEVPVTDPNSIEGTVLLRGEPLLVEDLQKVWDRLHPLNRQLALATKSSSIISVPLKIQNKILGAITADRSRSHSLTADDLNLMGTLAGQVSIALDNADAYAQIEALNVGLEAKVRERTLELEQLNKDLQAANEQLKQMDHLKSQFLAHVSHELRTPMTSIKGFAENMLAGLTGPLTDKQTQYLTRINANERRLSRMITDLLDRARIEAGKITLLPDEVSLPQVVAEVVEQLRPLALAKGHRLELQGHEADLTVWADADKVSQILTNLVDNAIKYTQDKGSVTVRIARDGAHFVKISVVDTGQGIPAVELPKIFSPFFRATCHQRSPVKGLGLGLSIAKDLVELH